MERKRLTDILHNGERDAIKNAWDHTEAADDFGSPLPKGEYVCHVATGELFTSKTNGTAGYKLCFEIIEGEHTGRRLWHDLWLTPAAMPMTKRDLGKLGVKGLEQLEQPMPSGLRCKLKVVLHTANDGAVFNRVRSFDVVGIDKPEPEPFAPADDSPAQNAPGSTGDRKSSGQNDHLKTDDGGDLSFDFGANTEPKARGEWHDPG